MKIQKLKQGCKGVVVVLGYESNNP